jgi:hypothetical protein
MKLRSIIASIGMAAAASGAGAFLLPASASPHAVTHTLAFTSVRKDAVNFSKTSSGQADLDVNRAGKTVGYDVLHFSFNPKTGQGSGGVTLDCKGGFLYGVLRVTDSPVIHGRVTGGTGAFRGATGTITAKALNKAGTRTAVTITYHR